MKKPLLIILTGLISINLGISMWNLYSTPKVVYIRSAILIEKYAGMKEAKDLYLSKVSDWNNNLEVLSKKYELKLDSFEREYSRLTFSERKIRELEIEKEKTKLEEYFSTIEAKSKEEEDKLSQGAINQINSFVEKYSKDKGYDIVLGVTQTGNILYGTDAIDITEEVVTAINAGYKN